MRPADAFEICHEVYVNARRVLDEKIGTLNPEAWRKYQWRPASRAKLGEFVADFALAGERALGASRRAGSGRLASPNRASPNRASRLVLFRLYYLGGAEYHAARKQLGISELTWAQWADEIRERVGRELLRAGIFPPGRYFNEPSKSRMV